MDPNRKVVIEKRKSILCVKCGTPMVCMNQYNVLNDNRNIYIGYVCPRRIKEGENGCGYKTSLEIERVSGLEGGLERRKAAELFPRSERALSSELKQAKRGLYLELLEYKDIQSIMGALLRLSIKELGLEEFLRQVLDMFVSLPSFAFEPRAGIFLVEDEPGLLVLKAQIGFSKHWQKEWARLPFHHPICGQAVLNREIQFIDGHYCVPILLVNRVLGAITIYLNEKYQPDSKKEYVLTSMAQVLAGIIWHKQTQKKSNEISRLLEEVFSTPCLLVACLETDFDFIRVNQAYAQAVGRTPEFFLGRNYFDLYPDENSKLIFHRVVETGEPYSIYGTPFEYIGHPEGQARYWDWSIHPLKDASGRVEGLILCWVDVSERRQMAQELLTTQKELLGERRLSDIGGLATIVAHELRNPLGVIRIAVYNLMKKSGSSSPDRHLVNIEKKIAESEQIINNLLSYSRIKTPHYEKINICDILEECITTAQNKFCDKKVTIVNKYRSIDKNIIEADPFQMAEVFNNILDNAYQSLAPKKGEIEIVAGVDSQGHMRISFRDNGEGIDKEDLEKIFDVFFTRRSRGTGLGLSICKQLVNLHAGKIEVESRKGKGTTVTVSLPIKRIIS